MPLYADLQAQHYLDQAYGTVSNQEYTGPGFNCDNPSLFSAEAMLLAGFTSWPGYPRFFDDAEVPGKTGLFHRYPGDTGNISVDEIIGAATLDQDVATSIYIYGTKNHWIFQPQGGKFTFSAWMGRFINLVPYVIHCTGNKMSIIDQILWSIGCVLSPYSSGTSGKLLQWVQIKKIQGSYTICDAAISFWKEIMTKFYPGGLQQIMGIYFSNQHPFYKWSPKDFN